MPRVELPIETERLVIRPMTSGDAEEMHRLWSDPSAFAYGEREPSHSIEQTHAEIARQAELQQRHGFALWAVCEQLRERIVGDCGLVPVNGGEDIELLCSMSREVRGRGYASEEGRACVAAAFRDFGCERVCGFTHPENVASRRVLKSVGMILHGAAHHHDRELMRYAVTRESAARPSEPAE